MSQQLPDGPRDLATLTFDLEGHAIVSDTALRIPYVYQVLSS